ncbi:copper amine oxidase N-terminal domain-containing protein [Paenibacillus soyae]|uniref:Copper amine oxidase N-terminal domain-containing protein n=1 Tax=Paenibacillus soyae TaxID=2969249 RepID=A0A9X2MSP3_9BACL|nr:copper amine oxidase N-terminal domain-containing protein [Paenibacillus soyae]MCR2805532.1 copper amine oxidase N-terminal domain-containing protein [Paenibacillus soyae]
MLQRRLGTRKKAAAALLSVMLLTAPFSHADAQDSPTAGTNYVIFYLDNKEAFLNGEQVTLDAPAFALKGKTYVPAKFLGDAFGMKVEWQEKTRTILMETPEHEILLDTVNKKAWVSGYEYPFDDVATLKNGRLMIKLTWLSDYMGATYTYNPELRRVDVTHVSKPAGNYDPDKNNSDPIAKFTFGKQTYRIGEPIKYINLSYDPDAEGVRLEWTGKEDVFFKPGTYPITLVVMDQNGHKSKPFTRDLVITDEVYLTEQEYPVYTKPAGGYITTDWKTLYGSYLNLPDLPKTVTEDKSRTLLMSDSPETFEELGILYQDTINGRGRLYADHLNGTDKTVSFAILATNKSDKPVTIKTTNKGEVYPSIYAHLIGSEAMVDYLMDDTEVETMTIPAGATFIYKQFPDFYPGSGVNLMYDVETDGEVQFTFAAAERASKAMLDMPKLAFNGHIRGTFQIAGFDWKVNLTESGLKKPMKLVLGDGKVDPFQKGFDPQRGTEATLSGNYGTVYKIHSDKPRKMAIMILAKGGPFKGPFKINGEMVKVPASGVLTAFDGMIILAKTTGKEESLDIEFSPPAGSAFPINLIFYPLDDRAE